jgi:hypothetical protein
MSIDGDLDCSQYSSSQISESLRNIDRTRFPINYERLRHRLEELQSGLAPPLDAYSSEVTTLALRRIKIGSIFRLVAVGLFFSFVPLCVLLGVFALFGFETVTWNDEPMTGIKGLFMSPIVGAFVASVFTACLGSSLSFGLWLYSRWRPLKVQVILTEESKANGAT